MDYIKKVMKESITDLNKDEVEIFKKSVEHMFLNLIDSINSKNSDIEKSIVNSFNSMKNEINIVATLIYENERKYYNNIFYPIIEEEYSNEKLMEDIKNSNSLKIGKLFFKENPYELITVDREFSGGIVSGDSTLEVKIRIIEYKKYKEKIEEIYKLSRENFIKWNTPNVPFWNKFYELEIVGVEGDISSIESIDDIYFNLEELEGKYIKNLCGVWNIEMVERVVSKEPVYISEGIYRYKTGVTNYENIILINNDYKIYSIDYDSDNLMEITTDKSDIKIWKFYQINNNTDYLKINNDNFPIWVNEKSKSFIKNYAGYYEQRIRSKAEINRLVKSMVGLNDIELISCEVIKNGVINNFYTYDVNSYIVDEIRDTERKDILLLKFFIEKKDYFTIDILSYIVSEIQMFFPEYRCAGEIV